MPPGLPRTEGATQKYALFRSGKPHVTSIVDHQPETCNREIPHLGLRFPIWDLPMVVV